MNNELTKRILSSVILIPISLFFIIKGSFFFNFFIIVCFITTSYEWLQMSKNKIFNIFGIIFLLISFISIYELRNDFNQEYSYLLFVGLICVSTDIGGYTFGKIFKGPKLTKISPKKTYAGMIGAFFLSIISANFFIDNINMNIQIEFTKNILFFILIISAVSQLGDIFVSYFKRLSKIKNTGKIIPGHGGLLDRVDGMIFAFPCSYLLFNIF